MNSRCKQNFVHIPRVITVVTSTEPITRERRQKTRLARHGQVFVDRATATRKLAQKNFYQEAA